MTEPAKAQTIDTEIARHCAFSFPAVALTLGRKNWACLRDTYELLASDMQVRKGDCCIFVMCGGGRTENNRRVM